MLLMPDLFNYALSGVKGWEYTESSTTQLLDAKNRVWSKEVIDALGLPGNIFGNIIIPGTKLGPLQGSICEELGVQPFDVIAVAGHDTQCALAAVPATEKDFLFVSCGTWSLFGTELDEPVIDANSIKYNVTNEGGFGGKISFLKNIIGLWLIQESRRQWIREGQEYSFGQLEEMAGKVTDAIVIRMDGHKACDVLDAILQVFPLDTYVEKPVNLMEVMPGDKVETPIWDEYAKIVTSYDERGAEAIGHIERFAFYEEAKKVYAIIATGESALYANVMLQKGVI